MKGKLWGIGVGPGDPELLTLKAVRLINECDVITVPREKDKDSVALKIVTGAIDIDNKEMLYLNFPMTKDKKLLEMSHSTNAESIVAVLEEGKDVAFITLGDVSIYSTFSYIQEAVSLKGFEVDICPGIPSFCAIGARLKVSLTSMEKSVHIIPAEHVDIEEYMKLSGTKVFMKAGMEVKRINECVKGNKDLLLYGISNCGMENEKILENFDIDNGQGYFTTLIVKEKD